MNKKIKELIDLFENPIATEYRDSNLYINRELSWLEFNKRVLFQTIRKEIPLFEKFNFLGITASNLDEFIMVRLASIVNKMVQKNQDVEISGLLPYQEYNACLSGIYSFKKMQKTCCEVLLTKLEKENVFICEFNDLNRDERRMVMEIFYKKIFPLITPINYDTTKEFPLVKSKDVNIVVSLEDRSNASVQVISFISLDVFPEKIFRIQTKKNDIKFISLENIIYACLDKIYVNKKITGYGAMKLLRMADLELEHNKDIYITDRMRNNLVEREYSSPIFMEVTEDMSKNLSKLLTKIFELKKRHVYGSDSILDYGVFQGLSLPEMPHLVYESFDPQYPSELIGEHDMLSAIDSGDILLHHPYQTFDPVIKFLEHAALDPDVLSIKQTLYRVSSEDSPIVEALCMAARNGKDVAVILEIKARFDEGRNISLIEKLKGSGCKLIYGVEQLKTHCKFIVIVKRIGGVMKPYSHIGTGNYNDKTSKVYTDISYFTSKHKIGMDLLSVFHMLSGFSDPFNNINSIYFSPYNLRKRLMDCIDVEINNAKNKKRASITIKCNSICDKEIIDKLYEASTKDVKVIIFCRGICSMKPINNNIIIKSIIGRFLEHSRIYYFSNNGKGDIYISSADLLTRNLDKRFEIMLPVRDNISKNKLLKILSLYYKDSFNSFKMNKKGIYEKVFMDKDTDVQSLFMSDAMENYKLKNIPKMMSYKKK